MNVTETLLRPLLASGGARPLITHYDEHAQTRVELSAMTAANWAAKTANWLVEEFDVETGDPVCVRLPAHWQTAGVVLGALWCGAQVVDDPDGARVAFVPPGEVDVTGTPVAVVALDAMGRGLTAPPPSGALDYLAEARIAGDDYTPLDPVPDESPALLSFDTAGVLAAARKYADAAGIEAGSRVLSTVDWTLPDGLLRGLLAPLTAGASLVHVTNPDPGRLDARRDTERTTVELTS